MLPTPLPPAPAPELRGSLSGCRAAGSGRLTDLRSIEAFVLLRGRCLIPIIAISIKVQRKVKREKSLLSPDSPGLCSAVSGAGGGRGLLAAALVSPRIWHWEDAGEGGTPPRWDAAGISHPAGISPAHSKWTQCPLLATVGAPGCVPAAPSPLGSGFRVGISLVCIPVPIPSCSQQRALRAAELAWEGLMLPLLPVSPRAWLGSSFPSFPTCLRWSEAHRPPLPAALGLAALR